MEISYINLGIWPDAMPVGGSGILDESPVSNKLIDDLRKLPVPVIHNLMVIAIVAPLL